MCVTVRVLGLSRVCLCEILSWLFYCIYAVRKMLSDERVCRCARVSRGFSTLFSLSLSCCFIMFGLVLYNARIIISCNSPSVRVRKVRVLETRDVHHTLPTLNHVMIDIKGRDKMSCLVDITQQYRRLAWNAAPPPPNTKHPPPKKNTHTYTHKNSITVEQVRGIATLLLIAFV